MAPVINLLSIVNRGLIRCNYPTTAVAFGSVDTNVQLMVEMAQDAADEIAERADWQALKQQAPVTFTGDGTTAMFATPITFGRLSPSDTFVSSLYPTLRLPGPINEDDLLRMKALPMSIATHVWRQVGNSQLDSGTSQPKNQIEFYPVLAAGEVVSYVYNSRCWLANSSGSVYTIPWWQADTDIPLIPWRLIYLGATYKWKRKKGFDYAEEMAEFEGALERLAGQEDTGRVIDMAMDIDPIDTWPGIITDLTNDMY